MRSRAAQRDCGRSERPSMVLVRATSCASVFRAMAVAMWVRCRVMAVFDGPKRPAMFRNKVPATMARSIWSRFGCVQAVQVLGIAAPPFSKAHRVKLALQSRFSHQVFARQEPQSLACLLRAPAFGPLVPVEKKGGTKKWVWGLEVS